MEINRIVYGSWGVILVVAICVAGWKLTDRNGGAEPKVEAAPQITSDAPAPLRVQTAAYSQDQTPGRLPVVSDSDPLADTKLKELRRIVAEEMPGASQEEMDVWIDEFRDLPEETVRFLLQQKRASDGPTEIVPLPLDVAPQEPVLDSRGETMATARRVREIVASNLLNTRTTGFRRQLIEFHSPAGDSVPGMGIAEVRWDTKSGDKIRTGRTFDLAITGPGLFVLEAGDQKLFTRAGRFRLNAQRRLMLPVHGRELIVSGVKPVPSDAVHVSVSAEGDVSAHTESEMIDLGRVLVAGFLDASRMQSTDGCVFSATPASGDPTFTGNRTVVQGAVEQSNADPRAEQSLLQQLEQWESLLRN